MHWRVSLLLSLIPLCLAAQGRSGRGGAGGFIPGEQRPTGDPAAIERGKTLYGIQCTGCHGADLRGGDMGGPNLLRSQALLSDVDGEKIGPILRGSRQDAGMPAFPFSPEEMKAVATYLRSVAATLGRQGMPPAAVAPASILVGDAKAGQAYFDSKCARCHSATGDLAGISAKFSDARQLQNTWVSGGGGGGRRRGGGADSNVPPTTATVTLPGGAITGRLLRIDDFEISVVLEDGTVRSFRRSGGAPKIEVHDPLQSHRDLLGAYTDQDIHNVTAYLATLK